MRPAFDRSDHTVRTAAFTLFGELCRFGEMFVGKGKGADGGNHQNLRGLINNFIDQCHNTLPILIVHMNDPEETVRHVSDGLL